MATTEITVVHVTPSMGPCATGRHEWHPGDERDCEDVDTIGRGYAALINADLASATTPR